MKLLLFILLLCPLVALAQIRPVDGFGSGTGGSGGSTNINSSTNGILNVATNGVAVSGVATQINLVSSRNILLWGTNASDKVSIGFDLSLSNANVLYLEKGGVNATAVRGQLGKPWATSTAVNAAATAGDTIVVFPGDYPNSSNLCKNGVNWFFYPGASLSWTNTTNDIGYGIFDDRFSGIVTQKIAGWPTFNHSGGMPRTNSVGSQCCEPTNVVGTIVETNALSRLVFENCQWNYQDLRASAVGAALYLYDGYGEFSGRIRDINLTNNVVIGTDEAGDNVLANSSASGVYWKRGQHHVNLTRNEVKGYALWPNGSGTDSGDMWYSADFSFGKLYSDAASTSDNYKVWVRGKNWQLSGTNIIGGTVEILNTGKFYLNIDKIGTEYVTDTSVRVAGAARVWINAQKVSATRRWLWLSGGATVDADVIEFEDLGSVDDGIKVDGAFLTLRGGRAAVTNTTGSAVNFVSAGSLTVDGMRISAANSTNKVVLLGANGAVFSDCTIIAKTTSYSIGSTVAAPSVNLQRCSSNTAETNAVTFAVGPWTVDGNVR